MPEKGKKIGNLKHNNGKLCYSGGVKRKYIFCMKADICKNVYTKTLEKTRKGKKYGKIKKSNCNNGSLWMFGNNGDG